MFFTFLAFNLLCINNKSFNSPMHLFSQTFFILPQVLNLVLPFFLFHNIHTSSYFSSSLIKFIRPSFYETPFTAYFGYYWFGNFFFLSTCSHSHNLLAPFYIYFYTQYFMKILEPFLLTTLWTSVSQSFVPKFTFNSLYLFNFALLNALLAFLYELLYSTHFFLLLLFCNTLNY